MDGGRWEAALRKQMGTKQGGVARSPSPGSMGNVAYAPGMMQFNRPSAPTARQVMGGAPPPNSPLTSSNADYGQSQGNTQPVGPTKPGGMHPAIAQQMMRQIMDALNRNLARTQRTQTADY